jgi:hypothetical protein
MKTPKFPKHLMVGWEEAYDEDGGFWIVYEDSIAAAELGRVVKVGSYKFEGDKTVTTRVEVE